jgi:uncharacterized membrane protein
MKNVNTVVSSALAAVIAMASMGLVSEAFAADKDMSKMNKMDKMGKMEKCYGVVKAGKNDCKTLSNACAGHSMTDGQKDAFIAIPAGTCERIVGGSMEAAS